MLLRVGFAAPGEPVSAESAPEEEEDDETDSEEEEQDEESLTPEQLEGEYLIHDVFYLI